MSFLFRAILFAASTAIATAATEPAIDFCGVSKIGQDTTFALTDRNTGASRWVPMGKSFENYVVARYDAEHETLTLTKEGTTLTLKLVESKVKAGPAMALVDKPTALAIYQNLRQLGAAADQFYLEHAANRATLDDLVGEKKYVRRLDPIAGEDYHRIVFLQEKRLISVTTASGTMITFDAGDGTAGSFYTVRPGDTAAQIARRTGVKLLELHALNDDIAWNRLNVGQVVRVR